MKCSLGISNFLEEISSLSHSVGFLYFSALFAEEGFLISPCYSLELCIQMGMSFLFSFAFCSSSFHSYLYGLFGKPFCLFVFLFLGDGLDPSLLYNVMKESEVTQSCPTLCNPMDCSPPGSSVHGIVQARVLEWIASSFSRGSSRPRDRTQVSCIAGRHFTVWATGESHNVTNHCL